jgi:channel protein (hemolysin III family)
MPIARIGLGGATGAKLLRQVWAGAGAGIAQQLLWPRAPKLVATAVYIALGWIIVPHAGEVGWGLMPLMQHHIHSSVV